MTGDEIAGLDWDVVCGVNDFVSVDHLLARSVRSIAIHESGSLIGTTRGEVVRIIDVNSLPKGGFISDFGGIYGPDEQEGLEELSGHSAVSRYYLLTFMN